jgi:hypothetical protein
MPGGIVTRRFAYFEQNHTFKSLISFEGRGHLKIATGLPVLQSFFNNPCDFQLNILARSIDTAYAPF